MSKLAVAVLWALLTPALLPAVERRHQGDAMSDQQEINADSLLSQADTLFQSHDYAAALTAYETALEAARVDFNRPVEVEALSQIARMHLIQGRPDEGRQWLERAQGRATDSDPMGWSRYLGVKGRFEWKADSLPAARKTFDEMYVYCNTNALWGRAVDAAHMLAIVAATPEEQVEWSRRGIDAAQAGAQEQWLGPLWNNLAVSFDERGQHDSALECFTKARHYHWQYSGEVAKLFADYHIGMTYRKLGKFEEAGQWLRPVLAWAERLGNHSAIGQACEDLGEIAIATGNKAEGLKLLKRARDEYKAEGYDQSWPEIWESINKRLAEGEK